MGKVLLWGVVIGLGWLAWSLVRVSQRKQDRVGEKGNGGRVGREGKGPAAREPEKIVACAHCGVHLPASDAVAGEGGPWCCVEHRDAARR